LGQGVSSQLVVIVDDSITNLKILERLAASLGDRVVAKSFASTDAALAFCAATPPDLILLAAAGAAIDSADFITRLRRQSGEAASPVIVVGAAQDLAAIEHARAAGAADHVLLPVDLREFRLRAGDRLRSPPAPETTAEPLP
jgi:CheY-like chemotaxis protein